MLVVLRPEAEQELLEAQAWYESKALGLGFEFARAADAAIASALRNPSGHVHRRRVPPSVISKISLYAHLFAKPGELLLVSFFHQHREPGV